MHSRSLRNWSGRLYRVTGWGLFAYIRSLGKGSLQGDLLVVNPFILWKLNFVTRPPSPGHRPDVILSGRVTYCSAMSARHLKSGSLLAAQPDFSTDSRAATLLLLVRDSRHAEVDL